MNELDPIREQWTLEELKDLLGDELEPEVYEVILNVWNNGCTQDFIPGFEDV